MHERIRRLEKHPVVRKLMRKLGYRTPLKMGKLLVRAGMPSLALPMLHIAERHTPRTQDVARAQTLACEALGDTDKAAMYRAERLRMLMPPHIKSKNYVEILKIMAELERTQRAGQFQAAFLISQLLVTEKGRETLLKAALEAKKRFRESTFLVHLITMCRGMKGDYRGANKMLVKAIENPYESSDEELQKQRMRILQQSWRVLDLIAREQMDWTDDSDETASPQQRDAARALVNSAASKTSDSGGSHLPLDEDDRDAERPEKLRASFKERALQLRLRHEYLEICDRELAQATTLQAKIGIIMSMVRAGIRHIPDYSQSYDHARLRLREHEEELNALLTPEASQTFAKAEQTVMDLCAYIALAHRLGREDLTKRITTYLLELSTQPKLAHALWPAPPALAHTTKDYDAAARIMKMVAVNPPRINRDMQHYFRWASLTLNYKAANDFFDALPKNLDRRQGLLHYVNILQRQGRFGHALRLLEQVHGQSLANPSRVNAFSNHSLIKRYGELKFLIETAKIYKSVPQPKDPVGIILIAPRNIDQLRRYPLMALLEFKRRGWAVLPMVEGLLPRETTGHRDIDVINGAVSPMATLVPRTNGRMAPIKDFKPELDKGRLTWGPIDLSHSIWEDSAINRRRYTIDYTCPELQKYLGGLTDWTRAMAQVLDYAHALHKKRDLKVGLVSLFNSRLPDSLFRFYCEEYGDPDTFFSLHTANGYQNYFTNFSTNISQRLVMRNMTRHPEVRSASFPLPENFERYFEQRRAQLPEIFERFAPITKVRRSTEGSDNRPPEAQALDARISEWRAKGGKVACAFGKVVCDSSVPFDGGPGHANMKDWINHSIRSVQDTNTLLLIKPHPHELNNQIATFPTEYFSDLLEEPLGGNAIFMGHRWFDMDDMRHRIDMGLVYNGTTTIELALMGIPCITAGHFAPIDYPIGQVALKSRKEYESYLRGRLKVKPAADFRERAAVWLDYMANDRFTQPYRFHARPVTNKVVYPPYWFKKDLTAHATSANPAVAELVGRALGERFEPGAEKAENTASGASRSKVAFEAGS